MLLVFNLITSDPLIIVPNQEVAEKLAGILVEKEIVACVNIIPGITSVYKWLDKIEV